MTKLPVKFIKASPGSTKPLFVDRANRVIYYRDDDQMFDLVEAWTYVFTVTIPQSKAHEQSLRNQVRIETIIRCGWDPELSRETDKTELLSWADPNDIQAVLDTFSAEMPILCKWLKLELR